MRVGILTVGNELTSGRTQDTNSAMIARALQEQGWGVAGIASVGDDDGAIRDALCYLLARAEAVVVTGGLGPTADDITTAAVAKAFGLGLRSDPAVLAGIRARFERFRLAWTENNAKQALFPDGAEIIPNPAGTAAGFGLAHEGRLVVVIPGVPSEARRMLAEGVIPLLRARFPGAALQVETATFKLFGLPESAIDAALADADLAGLGVAVGFYPTFPENHLVLTARDGSAAAAGERLREAGARVGARLARHIFASGNATLAGNIAERLTAGGLTLAVAESCTGGLIADRLTDIPGSSAFFERGVVTYSNASKSALLGVPEEMIARHGAVSAETAQAMAEGVRRLAGTDLGLAVTGIAGPAGGTESKPVGTVFVALACDGATRCESHAFRWDRRRNKTMASQAALLLLWWHLAGERNDGG